MRENTDQKKLRICFTQCRRNPELLVSTLGPVTKSRSCRMDILINKTQIYFVLKAMFFKKQLKRLNMQYPLHNDELSLLKIQFLISYT